MGVSNNALFFRENASNMSVIVAMSFGLIGGAAPMVPVLISIVVAEFLSAIVIPVNEEKTRKHLIKYLQNHEKVMESPKPKNRKGRAEDKDDIVVVKVEKYKKPKTNTTNSARSVETPKTKTIKKQTIKTKVERKISTKDSSSKGEKKWKN